MTDKTVEEQDREVSDIDAQNRKLVERIGEGKARNALQEVADTLDLSGSFRPLLDRAYEMGFKPARDGSVDFCLGYDDPALSLDIGGDKVATLTDTSLALDVEEAKAQGYVDDAELLADGGIGVASNRWSYTQNIEGPFGIHYRWRAPDNEILIGWDVLGQQQPGGAWVTRSVQCATYGGPYGIQNEARHRTNYRFRDSNGNSTGNRVWSLWRYRTNDSYRWSTHFFDVLVNAGIAHMQRGNRI